MMERTLTGFAAAPGLAAGPVSLLRPIPEGSPRTVPAQERGKELERARRALEDTANQLEELASRLRAEGRSPEADIVETGSLMARDPGLEAAVGALVLEEGRTAPSALCEAAEAVADGLARLPDKLLAERADDVRSLGRRAAASALGTRVGHAGGVLVAANLGPADVAELGGQVRGVALAGGGVTAHAAIVARSLGVPMVVGLGLELLEVADGETVVVDGTRGQLVRHPLPNRLAAAEEDRSRRRLARVQAVARRQEPAQTRDGRRLTVLANAASVAEVREALEQGAEGVGLLRTELLFLEARAWPTEADHVRFLAPLLAPLAGRAVTIRLLDFGADKTPPFLAGSAGRGIELQLEAPEALRAQLGAILAAAADTQLRILVPMVTRLGQVRAVRQALLAVADGPSLPRLGAMIETREAAGKARELAAELDFLSLGTNDLTQSVLGLDRESSCTAPVVHPEVLRLVDVTIRAGRERGIPVEVCGEAASDPATIPLLVGLGADELSVGAARVGEVRELVRGLEYAACRELARRSLLDQAGHAGAQGV